MSELSAVTPAANGPGLGADQVLDTLPSGLLAVSAAGLIQRLNRQAAAWWGVPAAAALGQTIGQAGPGQLPAPAYAALAHAASEPTAAAECYLPATEQWLTVSSAAQPTGELVVHWQDSTAAHQRAQQYQALAENTPDVLTRWSPDLRLLYANGAFAAKAGQPLPALLGRTFAEMGLPAEVTDPYQAVLQRVFATGQPQEHYNVFPGPHGPVHYHSRLVPELRDGQIDTVLGIARDISALKRTEAETLRLRETLAQQATDRYHALFHATEQGFCVLEILLDDAGQAVDFRYLELNPTFAEQAGMPADAQGKTACELLPNLEPFWLATYGRVARTGEPVRFERLVPQMGRWVDVHAFRVGAPEARQVAVLFTDITARKQTEATLRRAAEAETFRLHLADALGPLTDAGAIQEVVTHQARLHFAADRCYYCEIEGGQALIRRDAAAEGLPSVAGTYPLADFALLQAVIEAGRPFSVPDVRQDESVDENLRQLCVQLQVISYLDVPVVKNGATVGVLCLVQSEPRAWTAADVDLAAEVAERTWVAVERARAEAALTTSESKYRMLFESIDEGFCVIDLQVDDQGNAVDWVYQEANPAFEEQTGFVHAVGQRISALQPGLERAWFERFAAVARTGEPTRFVQAAEAMHRWFDAYAFRVGAAGENRVALLFTDISDRKRREANAAFLNEASQDLAQLTNIDDTMNALGEKIAAHLRLSACLFAELFEAAQIAVIAHGWQRADMPNLLRTYRTTEFMSDEIRQLCLSGQPVIIRDVFADPRTDGAQYATLRIGSFVGMPLIRAGEWRFLLVVYRPEPSDWHEEEIEFIRELMTRIWTRLERARAEAALRESETRLHVALDAAELGTFVWHVAEDRTEADVRALQHFGLPPDAESTLAEALAQRLHPEDGPRYVAAIGRATDPAGPGTLNQEFRIRRPDGERWMAVTATAVFEGSPPAATRLVGVLADITARKQQQEHQVFLLKLSDTLRAETDVAAVGNRAVQLIAEQLGADRVYLVTLSPDDDTVVITHETRRADLPPLQGAYRSSDFPSAIKELFDHTIVYDDVRTDARLTEQERLSFAGLSAVGFIAAPIRRGSEAMIWAAGALSTQPRSWTAPEIALFEDAVERTWAAVERARVEQALRRSEEVYRTLFDSIDEGYCLAEILLNENGQPADVLHLEVNQAHQRKSGLGNIVGQRLLEFMPEVEPEWLDFYGNVALTGQPARLEYQVAAVGRWFTSHASRVGGEGSRLVAIVFDDITARKHHEQRQQFLLQLSDRLRPLADPLAVQQAALRWVGEQLGLDRLLFNEIDPEVTTYHVRASYVREGFLAYGGQQPMGPFTESVRALQQGITKVVYDVETDDSFSPEEKAICAGIRVRAFVVVPLVKDGRWLVNLVAHASQPRPWPPHEVALLEETAERTWAAVEQAKVEAALRESEAQLRSFVTASSDTLYRMSADWQQMHSLHSKDDFMAPTTAPSETWLTRYIPAADQPAVQAAVQAAIAGRRFFELEHRVYQADGAVGWTFSRAVPVLGPQGELVEWFGTASDITARKTAEDALRRSEERLLLALDAAELGTWDWDIATNEVRWNERHFTMLGLSPRPGLLAPADFARAIHPDDRAQVLERLQAAVAGNHLFEAEFRILTPQHDVRWMSGHGQPTAAGPDGRVHRMTGVLLDVTARKHAEQYLQTLAASLERKVARRTQALQESQQLLQSVYDTTLIGLAVLHAVRDEATGAITDFTFISVNKELARLSGRPDLVGRRYGPAFPGPEARGILARMAQAVDTGQPQQTEFSYSVGGVLRWVAFMCVKLDGGVVATLLDRTERKHAEQQLTRNLHLLEQAETVAQLGSWDYELASGQFYWSGGMYALFGLPLGQPVLPSIYLDYVLAEDRPQAEQLVRQISTGAGDFETTLRLQVGAAVKTVRIKAVVLRDAAGQPVRVLGVDLDLSELHRLEADNLRLRLSQQQALFEAVQAAEEAERRRMSESLHNGIGQILYATKLQLDRLPAAPELSPQRRAADLLSDAIRQTRTLSHELTPAILEQFGLEKTLRSLCSALNTPNLRWRCHLEFGEAPPLPMSLQLAVYRLAQELAQNVLKHAQATQATLEIDVLPAWVVLRVEDDGQGFDPTQTSDGLGLRSLRSRAALLGGSVHLTTAPGQGTQCQIRLPLTPIAV